MGDKPKRVIVGDDPGPTIESVLLEAIESATKEQIIADMEAAIERIKTERRVIVDDPIESVIERVREGVLS